MTNSFWILLGFAAILAAIVAVRMPNRFVDALRYATSIGLPILLSIPFAMLAAFWLSSLIPPEVIAALMGADRGFTGILIASLVGSFLPGGPMVAFPIALVLWNMGTGTPQMAALLTSWSIFAVHRTIVFELPIMGPRFVLVKLAVTWILPPLAGLLAAAALTILR